ncbi:Chitinase A1 precursor [Actinomadura rubteroloni]|uniref:Chitinase A1 n=1 Tax=Actinomadura rubteroloni TaxID=1926885 RepID=A0A2P4UPQ5_9ACTN|nr:fibronectin type III domain-containing protein [Actinomadura rubteroloni]POM27037.1 Chitinase A1 precursor [Actinomadura rubteroloni]
MTVPAKASVSVLLAGQAGIPRKSIEAVAAQLTVSGQSTGDLLAYPNGELHRDTKTARTLSYVPGTAVRGFSLLRLGSDGRLLLANRGAGPVKVDITVEGYLLDRPGSRPAGGFTARGYEQIGQVDGLAPGTSRRLRLPAGLALPDRTDAVMLQAVARAPQGSKAGAVSLTPAGQDPPASPQVTYAPGRVTSNTLVTTSPDGGYVVRNQGSAAVDISVALIGVFADTGGSSSPGQRFVPVAQLPLAFDKVTIEPRGTTTIDLDGQHGVPRVGTALTAAALAVTANSSGDGVLRVRAERSSGKSGPAVLPYSARSPATGTAVIGFPKSGRRTMVIENDGDSPVTVAVDLQGYARTLAAPKIPTAVTATAGESQATVVWTPPIDDGGASITGYTVKASPGGRTARVTGAATRATVTGLHNAKAYTFTVTATNAVGTSGASARSTAVTPLGTPGAPALVSVSAGNGSATLAWKKPADDGGRPITAYAVRAMPGGKTVVVAGDKRTATVTGLTNGRPYTLTVTAANATGTGDTSAPSRAVTPAGLAAAPTAVTATADDGRAVVTWAAPRTTGGTPITGYAITTAPGGKIVRVSRGQRRASVTGLVNGTAYTFMVTAQTASGPGARSAASRPVVPTGKPSAPTQVTATPGDRWATVTWAPPRVDGGVPVSGYTVSVVPGGKTIRTDRTSLTISGLSNDTTYTFVVRASNARGTGTGSEASAPVTPSRTFAATTTGAPGAPTQVSAVAGDRQAAISWSPPADDGGSPITGYTVTSSPGGLTATAPAGSTTATVTGLTNGTVYTFTVKATNALGVSVASAPSNSVTPPGFISLNTQIGGPKVTLTTTIALQDGRVRFSGVAGQRVSVAFSGSSFSYGKVAVSLVGPGGTVVAPNSSWSGSYLLGPVNLPSSGEYTVLVDPVGDVTGSVGLQVFEVADQILAATVGGASVQVATTVPGQDGRVRFSGTVGQRVSVAFSGSSFSYGKVAVSLVGPGGTVVAPNSSWSGSYLLGPVNLPSSGEYTVLVDPVGDATGSVSVQVSEVADQMLAATVNGPAVQVSTPVPGQDSRVQFAGTAGQQVTFWLSGSTYATGQAVPSLLKPNGTVASTGSEYWTSGAYKFGPLTLTDTGTYTFLINPKSISVGGVTVQITDQTASVPGAPDAPTAQPGDRQATISWAPPPVTGGLLITGYTVTASPGGRTVTAAGSATSATLTGLTNGTAYTFKVRATNRIGNGPDSTASAPVTPFAPPSAPQEVSATAGDASATVTWTAPSSDGGSAVTGYTVTASPGGQQVTTTATSATVNSLTNGTAYTFTVTASNAGGPGAASAPSDPVTPRAAIKPDPPTQVSAVPGDQKAVVSWTAPAQEVASYTVTADPGGRQITTSDTTATITGLTNGTSYTFTVTATSSTDTVSDPSQPSSPVTPTTVPDGPGYVSAEPHDRAADVTWLAPADNGGSPITSYRLTVSPGGTVVTTSGTETTAHVAGLTNGTLYKFTVVAVNALGVSPSVTSGSVVPQPPPGQPDQVTAIPGDGQVRVMWEEPASVSPITSYEVTASPGGQKVTVEGTEQEALFTGLTNDTAYTFTVVAINEMGAGAPSEPSTPVTPTALAPAPTGVTAVAGDRQTTVSWTAPSDNGSGSVLSYTVTGNGRSWSFPGDQTSGVVTGLTNGVPYTFVVTAVTNAGPGASSAPSPVVTPNTRPGSPTDVTAVPGATDATVTWSPPEDTGGLPITGYTVTVSPGGRTLSIPGDDPATDVTDLTRGTTYTFTVTATTAGGTSDPSAASTPITLADLPGVPTGVTATPGDGTAHITWTAPADDGGAALNSYTVIAHPGGRTAVVDAASTTADVTGLTNGTAYTFTVTATSEAGTGTESAESAPVTPTGPPDPPRDVTAVPGDGQATIHWTAPLSGGSPITGYTVIAAPGGATVTSTDTTATMPGLTNGTAYTFTVTAASALGVSRSSSASEPVTPGATPAAPTGVTAVAGNGQAQITWSAPTGTGGAPLTGFTVTASPGGRTATVGGNVTTATVTGLTNGTSYTFTVTATNGAAESPASDPSGAVTPTGAAGAPGGVTAVSRDSGAHVTWQPPASNGGSPITSYGIAISPGGITATAAGTSTSADVTGLTNGVTYTVTVTALNAGGSSEPSASTTVIPARLPGAPTQVSATALDSRATVTWTAPADTGGAPITSYKVTASPGGTSVVVTGTTATMSGLVDNTAYTFTVTATNPAGEGPASGPSTPVTPVAAPGAPGNVAAQPGDGKADVTWDAPGDPGGAPITAYVVTASPGEITTTVSGTSATLSGLTNGTRYTITVTAVNAGGSGPASPWTRVTPVAVPGTPLNVQIGAGADYAQLYWSAPSSDGGSQITSYTATAVPSGVSCATGTCPTVTVNGYASTARLTGLTSGASYEFRLHATNAVGDGADWVTTADLTPGSVPGRVQDVQAIPKEGEALLRWSQPEFTGDSPITSYTVTVSPGGRTISVPATTAAVYQVTVPDLTDNSPYTFTIAAVNSYGSGLLSAPTAEIVPGRVPGPPVRVVAAGGDGVAEVSWASPADQGTSPVDRYVVYNMVTGQSFDALPGMNSAAIPGVANGTKYAFQVTAANRTGTSLRSARSNPVTPQQTPPPGRPLVTSQIAGDRQTTVTWSPPDTGAASVTRYDVTASPGGATAHTDGSQRQATLTGLDNGTAYTFTVTATNSVGTGEPSPISQPVTPKAPDVPQPPDLLTVTPGDGTIDVRWTPADGDGAPITSYTLTAKPGDARVEVNGTTTHAQLTGLTNGTSYTVALTATSEAGTSLPSVKSDLRPQAHRAPVPPSDLTATIPADGSIRIGWSPPADSGTSPTTTYTVTVQPGGQTMSVTDCASDAATCAVTWPGLDQSTPYSFSVTASSADGTSLSSASTAPVTPKLAFRHPVKALSAAAASTLTAIHADGTLVFDGPPPEVAALTPGQYVTVPSTNVEPRGYLAKVVSVANKDQQVAVATEKAGLPDILSEGSFAGSATLNAGNVLKASPGSPGVEILNGPGAQGRMSSRGAPSGGPGPLDPIILRVNLNLGRGAFAKGTLAVTPVVNWELHSRSATIAAKAVVTGSLQLHTSGAWGPKGPEISLGHYIVFAQTVWIGDVPVEITVDVTPTAKIKARATGAIDLRAMTSFEAGAQVSGSFFKKPTFRSIYANHTRAVNPVVRAQAYAEVAVQVDTEVSIYESVSVGIESTPYVRLESDINANPWWRVRAGARYQACAELLGGWIKKCTPPSWLDLGVTIAHADGPFTGLAIVPSQARTVAGQPFQFIEQPINTTDGPVSWRVTYGPGHIDSDGLYQSADPGTAVVEVHRQNNDVVLRDAQAVIEVGAAPPGPPAGVQVTPGPLSALVSWQPPAEQLEGIIGYAVVASPDVPTVFAEASDRSVRLTGLAADQLYTVQVYALSLNGMSQASNIVSFTPSKGITENGDAVNIAVDSQGNPDDTGIAGMAAPAILSGDGNYAFLITAADSNLVPPSARQAGSSLPFMLRKNLRTGEIDLASVAADGHTPIAVMLTSVGVPDSGALASADGTKIAYLGIEGCDIEGLCLDALSMHVLVHDMSDGSIWNIGSTRESADGSGSIKGPFRPIAISGDGETLLYNFIDGDLSTNSGFASYYWQRRGGSPRVVAKSTTTGGIALWGADMSADGNTVVYARADFPPGETNDPALWQAQLWAYRASDESAEVAVSGGCSCISPNISPDGSTVTYASPNGSGVGLFTRKLNAPPDASGVGVADVWGTTTAMDMRGRYIAYFTDGSSFTSGIYDSYGAYTSISARNITGMSYDASRTLGVTGEDAGVWLQAYDVPTDQSDLSECNQPDYGSIGQHGRRTGIRVKLCGDGLGQGGPAAPYIRPPGWPSSTSPPGWPTRNSPVINPDGKRFWLFNRGHLLANVLGGSGTDSRNLVTEFAYANQMLQKSLELPVAQKLSSDPSEEIFYYAIPVYSDLPRTAPLDVTHVGWNDSREAYPSLDDPMPNKIHIVAQGTQGYHLDACIPNTQDYAGYIEYDAPCIA